MNPVFELLTKIAEVFTGPQKSRLDAIAKPVEQYDPTPPRPVDWNEAEKNIRPEDADTTKRGDAP